MTKDLKRDILATGVARGLGFSVREAKDVATQNGHFVGDARRVLDQAPPAAGTPAAPATPGPEAWGANPSITRTLKSVIGSLGGGS